MELFFRQYGTGKPFIILHGLFGQSDNWQTLAKRWGAEGFQVFTVDLRNHGLSGHSDEFDYSVMSRDIQEFIQQQQLEKPILMGHSMGGKVAMQLAVDVPALLGTLIVSDIAPRYYKPHHQSIIKGLSAVQPGKISSRKEAEDILLQYIDNFGTRQFLLKNLYWQELPDGNKQLNWRFNLPAISRNIEKVGEELLVPPYLNEDDINELKVLFVRGEHSEYIKDNDMEQIERIFPQASLVTIADSGHWIHADKPDAFFDAINGFLTQKSES